MRRHIVTLFALWPFTATHAGCEASSPPVRAGILSLYTSEGCNSCPPAERWLASLSRAELARAGWVPLAFHVDYWDGLGWKDPYAQAAFSERQRQRADRRGWVYTPQFTFDGVDLPGNERTTPTSAMRGGVPLSLSLTPEPERFVAHLRLPGTPLPAGVRAYFALYENGLTKHVPAGENAGHTLRHEYVVRRLSAPQPAAGTTLEYEFRLEPGWKRSRLGVAAWLETPDGRSLQALSVEGCQA